MANLDFREQVKKAEENNIKTKEGMLARSLLEPFASVNSGSRKLMYAKELDQVFPLINGEKAVVETGYEIRYGDLSSSIVKADDDYVLLAKIPKFSFAPNHHYFSILGSRNKKYLHVDERKSYQHNTEAYGYLNNTSAIDAIKPGDYISKGDLLHRSVAFDDYGNRRDGINLNTIYMSLDTNYEDSYNLCEDVRDRYTSPLVHYIREVIPENYIPINWYGNDSIYKVQPDIGESLRDCILSAFRLEIKDESLYNQTKDRLTKIMISDEKKIVRGDNLRLVDMNIYTNNPDLLKESPYYAQYNMYYQEQLRFAQDIDTIVSTYIGHGFTLSRDLQQLHFNCKRLLRGDKYIDKRLFTNMIVDLIVVEERKLEIGDKLADRNGGKGVVSKFIPRDRMPILPDGTRVDAIINSPTMYNRQNPSQSFEVSLTHIGRSLINCIVEGKFATQEEAIDEVIKYVSFVVPAQAEAMRSYVSKLSKRDMAFYLESIIRDKHIDISSKPISESYDIDRLNELYKAFPYIAQTDLYVSQEDSNGNYRYIKARRKTICGLRYTLRLKQFSEEKFSATSLSSTNLRNENVKSKAANNYNAAHSSTCVRIGSQEAGDMAHMGNEYVVNNLMLHSSSPHARRLTSAMNTTDDPYNIDIKLYEDCNSRFAEIAQTYLKAIGLRFSFAKKFKKILQTARIQTVSFLRGHYGKTECVSFFDSEFDPNYDPWEAYKNRAYQAKHTEDGKLRTILFHPVKFLTKNEDMVDKYDRDEENK